MGCKIEYVEECPEPPSYGRQKREASDEDQSREKRQVQNCQGGNCAQNNLGAGGFGAGAAQIVLVATADRIILELEDLDLEDSQLEDLDLEDSQPPPLHFLSEVSEVVSL